MTKLSAIFSGEVSQRNSACLACHSRTLSLKAEFGRAFHQADQVFITDIYAASETPILGVTGQLLVDQLIEQGHCSASYEPSFEKLRACLGGMVHSGDLVLTLGAGNIHEIAAGLIDDLSHLERLRSVLAGEGTAKLYEPLARHTTLRVGGPAQFWIEPTTEHAFARLVRYGREYQLPIFVLGRGSNLLVRDGGIEGLVIHPAGGDFARIEVDVNKLEISAGVAVGLKRLAGTAAKAGIGGFEWMAGIPGAVGGSLRMNAGAMGEEMFGQVVRVRVLDATSGRIVERVPAELEVNYRSVPSLSEQFALAATFHGRPSNGWEIEHGLQASYIKRKTTQPVAASAGCIFKNPSPEVPAGFLVEQLGLKRLSVGAAQVSEIHGNFIVNNGGASAKDVLSLIEQIQEVALRERGIRLEPEVQIIGKE